MTAMDLIGKGIKARREHRHSVTVPVRRGWILSLALSIPSATITFHGDGHRASGRSPETHALLRGLSSLISAERRATGWVSEIVPEEEILTYALGVPLRKMSNPAAALARVPAAQKEDHDDPVTYRAEDRAGVSGALRGE
jgi:hypothetical protein